MDSGGSDEHQLANIDQSDKIDDIQTQPTRKRRDRGPSKLDTSKKCTKQPTIIDQCGYNKQPTGLITDSGRSDEHQLANVDQSNADTIDDIQTQPTRKRRGRGPSKLNTSKKSTKQPKIIDQCGSNKQPVGLIMDSGRSDEHQLANIDQSNADKIDDIQTQPTRKKRGRGPSKLDTYKKSTKQPTIIDQCGYNKQPIGLVMDSGRSDEHQLANADQSNADTIDDIQTQPTRKRRSKLNASKKSTKQPTITDQCVYNKQPTGLIMHSGGLEEHQLDNINQSVADTIDDIQTQPTHKRRGRGPCKADNSKRSTKQPKIIDQWGYNKQPIGEWSAKFTTDLGILVRCKVNINMTWKMVSNDLKDQMWAEIQRDYVIDESKKGTVIAKMCIYHNQWRHKLRAKYIKKTLSVGQDNREPYEVYEGQITKEDWLKFKASSETPEFQELSEKNKERALMHKHHHVMGRCGYAKSIPNWKESGLINHFLPNSETGSTQPTEGDIEEIPRYAYWFCARTRLNDKNELEFPVNSEEMQRAKEQLDKVQKDHAKGTWNPDGRRDILSAVVGKPDHPGRARGFGGNVGYSDVFGREKRSKSQGIGSLSQEQLDVLRAEIRSEYESPLREKVEELKAALERNKEEMATQLRETLADIGIRVPAPHRTAGSPTVSQQTIYSTIPNPESYLDGPRLTTGERGMSKGDQNAFVPSRAPREEATLVKYPLVNMRFLNRLKDDVLELHEMLELFEPNHCRFSVPLSQEMFYYTSHEFETIISLEDFTRFLTGGPLSISILQSFLLYISSRMEETEANGIGFLCPSICSHGNLTTDKNATKAYLMRALLENIKSKSSLIMLPYNHLDHWVLIVICPHVRKGYVFDPASAPGLEIILKELTLAFKIASSMVGNGRGITFSRVECRKQPRARDCGHYVMRYMYDIISSHPDSCDIGLDWRANEDPYSTQELDEIRNVWSRHFIDVLSNL